MKEQLTQPDLALTEEQLKQIDGVYKNVINTQGPILAELGANNDKDTINTRDLSVRKEIDVIDASEVESHELALTNINGLIKRVEDGVLDYRDLPDSIRVDYKKDKISAKDHIKIQKDRLEDIANVIDARLLKRDRDGEFFDGMKAHNKALDELAKSKEAHARRVENVTASEVSASKRALVKKEMGRQALIYGQINLDKDPELLKKAQKEARNNVNKKLADDPELLDKIKIDAKQKAMEKLGKGPEDPNTYDTNSQEARSKRNNDQLEKRRKAQEHKKMVNNFNSGINSEDDNNEELEVKDFGPAGIVIGSEEDIPKVIETNQTRNKDIQDMGEAGVLKPEAIGDIITVYPEPLGPSREGFEAYKANNPGGTPPPTDEKSLFSRIKNKVKEAWAKDPAVRFDGKDYTGQTVPGKRRGDAIVDTREREYKTRHYVAAAALGAGAVGIAFLATKGIHSPMLPILGDVNYKGGGFPAHEVPVPSKLGTIKDAETAKDVVTGALDRFGVKGYSVEGDTSSNVAKLVKSLKESGSIDLIVGRNADGTGHVVSAARDLADGMPGNVFASQEVAINPADLKDFMEQATEAGIKITEK